MSGGVTFDAGALIALEREDRRVLALLSRAALHGSAITIPATVLAQVIRNPARQARIARLLRQPEVRILPLDRPAALMIGRRLEQSGSADVIDAHVALCAERLGQAVVTSDPDDLRRLSPGLKLIPV